MAQFEGYERREAKILAALKEDGISSIDECKDITLKAGIDVDSIKESRLRLERASPSIRSPSPSA